MPITNQSGKCLFCVSGGVGTFQVVPNHPTTKTYLPCHRNQSLRKALQPRDYEKVRVMMDIVGMAVVGFLTCLVVAQVADKAFSFLFFRE